MLLSATELSIILALCLSTATAAAVPPLESQHGETFTIKSQRTVRRGRNSVSRRGLSVPAVAETDDDDYYIPVSIGSKAYNLFLDTGSAELWVGAAQFANPANATCVRKVNYSWGSYYGGDPAWGSVVCFDKVSIGSSTAQSQAVEVAKPFPSWLSGSAVDGLIGLAPVNLLNSVKPVQQNTWLTNAGVNNFAMDLKHGGGRVTFGGAMPASYKGRKVTYQPLASAQVALWGMWNINATAGYTVGKTHYADNNPAGAIIDSGTTLLWMASSVAQNYYASVKNATWDSSQQGYVFPCSESQDLPDFKVSVGDHLVNVPGSLLTFSKIDPTSDICYGSLQAYPDPGYPDIYGMVFLKAVYAIFDVANQRVGVAQKAV